MTTIAFLLDSDRGDGLADAGKSLRPEALSVSCFIPTSSSILCIELSMFWARPRFAGPGCCADGRLAKATLTAISNARRGSGDEREEEATVVQWTLWGKQAENAAQYLCKGSHVNIAGRLRNNNYYQDASGADVYAISFTCEKIDYLDSRLESEARRTRQEPAQAQPAKPTPPREARGSAKA